MDDLIRFDTDNQTISARELHEKLNINTKFSTWFERMTEYGFAKGLDFFPKTGKTSDIGGRPAMDYDITIAMAKEICMIQRTPVGKKIREYLIQVEKAWNTPSMIYARALKMADAEIHSLSTNIRLLEAKIESDKPKVQFAEAVDKTKGGILIRDLAKLLSQNGIDIGEKRLFAWMRDKGYLLRYGSSYNTPSQKAVEMKLFEVTEHVIDKANGSFISPTVRVTGKGQQYFINKFLSEKEA